MEHRSYRRWSSALLAVFFILPLPALAAETINAFDVSATLQKDRQLTVEETITYDFGDATRHGIYRDIPIQYERNGANYSLHLNVESVTRDGKDETFTTSQSSGKLEVKIGSTLNELTGKHVYKITYDTDRAINFFPDGHSELYWNVTGDQWEVPIETSSFTLKAPTGANLSSSSVICFTGAYGSPEQACTASVKPAEQVTVTADRVLLSEEGLTVATSFSKGVIAEPTVLEYVVRFLTDNGVLVIPLAAFFIMLFVWFKKGRDPRKRTVIPEYEPPAGYTPAALGCAMTESGVPNPAITATIIDLARRGYLHIRFGEEKKLFGTKQTFTFVKQKDADDTLKPYEKEILTGLFEGGNERTIEDLKADKFYKSVALFRSKVTTEVDGMGVFVSNPTTVRGLYIALAFAIGFVLTFFTTTPLATAAGILTGIIIALFGWFMPRRTDAGVKLLADIEGFKWFLSVTEKDRLAFTDAPQRTPEQFNAFLPFAIVFGVEQQWAKQFESLNIQPPNWAEGNIHNLNSVMLASSLSDLHRSASSSAFAAPSQAGSGGSGFSGGGSGGGFGGGGGGSW